MKVKPLLFLFYLLFSFFLARATHIVGGEITYELVDPATRTFKIYITGYVDLIGGQVTFGGGQLDFGDGSEVLTDIRQDSRVTILIDEQPVDNSYIVGITKFMVEHSFLEDGKYIVSYIEANRNDGILNMDNSVETLFYTESLLSTYQGRVENNSVEFIVPANLYYCSADNIEIPLGAYDSDGDSLSFSLQTPMQGSGEEVINYLYPNSLQFNNNLNEPVEMAIDGFGNIKMFSPALVGEYVLSIKVIEWRIVDGHLEVVGSVLRDLMFAVDACTNDGVEIDMEDTLTVISGITSEYSFNITGFEKVDGYNEYNSLRKDGSVVNSTIANGQINLMVETGCHQLSQPVNFLILQLMVDGRPPTVNKTSTVIVSPITSQCSYLQVVGNTHVLGGEQQINVVLKNTGLKTLAITDIVPPEGISVSQSTFEIEGESEVELIISIDESYDGKSRIIEVQSDADGGDRYILIKGNDGGIPLGLKERTTINDLVIYPNPTKDHIYFESDKIFVEARVYSIDGTLISRQSLRKEMVDLEEVPAGVFMIQFIGIDRSETYKIVIER